MNLINEFTLQLVGAILTVIIVVFTISAVTSFNKTMPFVIRQARLGSIGAFVRAQLVVWSMVAYLVAVGYGIVRLWMWILS